MMYGSVGANTNSSYGKCTGELQKLPKFSIKAMEEQFTCITYQEKQDGSVILTNNRCTEQYSSYGKMYGPHSKYRLKSS